MWEGDEKPAGPGVETADVLLSSIRTAQLDTQKNWVNCRGERACTPGYTQAESGGVSIGVIDHHAEERSAMVKHLGPGIVQLW